MGNSQKIGKRPFLRREKAFTLLEVLIALAILSTVALVIIRATGEGLVQIGENGWKDLATRLGRNQMLILRQQGMRNTVKGNFGPAYPQLAWEAKFSDLRDLPGRKMQLIVRNAVDGQEIVLERIIVP